MQEALINCNARDGRGKGTARKLRAQGLVPGVVYGQGTDSIAISFSHGDLRDGLSGPLGHNTVLRLKMPDTEQLALLQTYQIHPIERSLLHVDFLAIDENRPVTVKVPVHETGKCAGIVNGGILSHIRRELQVQCLPSKIPQQLDIDITELDVGQSLHAGDVTLPEGITLADDPRYTLFVVGAMAAEEEPTTDVEVEGEAPAEGDAAPDADAAAETKSES